MPVSEKFANTQALITGVALESTTDGLPSAMAGSYGAAHVAPPSELPGNATVSLFRDITTTRQAVMLPSGAVWVNMAYRLLPGATATANQFARYVVNASSDSDADGKLATDGAFFMLCQGDSVQIAAPSDDPITRIDVIASVAVGSEKTLLQVMAGVIA